MKKNTKRHIWRSFFIFCAILIFTFLDWLVHQSSSILEVPSWYFTNNANLPLAGIANCVVEKNKEHNS